ncbi:hypothetical protein [Candidatus Avelusimicrobium fimicolum]|uniref:hypothetical protein n=1 Tax=Candidatus Avelusimicrobium fimicolum TaxID=3416216 RepID=UPI003D0DFF40
MTVSNTTVKLTYAGNGSNRVFGITFPLLSASHLRVVVTDPDGVETNVTSNFTINTALNALTYPTVASGLEPLATGYTITLVRQTPLTQEIDLHVGHALDAAELERGYDKLTYAVQEIKEEVGRAVKTGVSESAPETAEAYMDAITAAKEAAETAATSAAGSASEAVVASATAAAASTEATTQAQAAAQSADTATSAAVTAQSAMEGAQVAQAAAETAAASIATAISEHNQSTDAHADIRTAISGKQDTLPSGTVGQYLRKTATGVAWAEVSGGAGGTVNVDDALSATSTNPVQNKVIKAALDGKQATLIAGANVSIGADGRTISVVGGGGAGGTVDVDGSLSSTSTNPVQNKAIKAAIDAKQDKLNTTQTAAANSGITAEKVTAYDTHTADTDLHVSASEKATWTAKQDAISDLATIRQNASAGAAAATAAGNYGNIVSHNADEFQPSGNYAAASHTHTKDQITDLPPVPTKVSQLTNDSGFLTGVPAATASTLGGVKLNYDSATQTLTITAQ